MSAESLARAEATSLAQTEAELAAWFASPRFALTRRPYTAAQVARLRNSVPPAVPLSNLTAKKLYAGLRAAYAKKTFWHTFGALDPVQVALMAPHLKCVYVSGWQCSSTASTNNEPGPDFADYPADTVPNKVDQLFRAQLMHDRRQREARARMTYAQRVANPAVDYLRPIIADGDTGFGGVTSVMKLMKMHIEGGAAAVHIEDQKPGTKKCGHMGGKVLVSVREHFDRLSAARLQADIMGTETLVIARTDANTATFLDTNIDPRDHPFIAGATNPAAGSLQAALLNCASTPERQAAEQAWLKTAGLKRYQDAVADAMRAAGKPPSLVQAWVQEAMLLGNAQARARAAQLGFANVFWDWDAPRPREGYFRVIGGAEYSAMRAVNFAPLADVIWMETKTPNLKEATFFANFVHARHPQQMLCYNLSPSFNWSRAGMEDAAIQRFMGELGKLGFSYQFITLAGYHSNALIVDQFSKAFAGDKKVLAYVEMIQREEERLGVEALTHQKFSGAELMDFQMGVATGGGSSTASLHGSTEDQFKAKL